MDIAGRLDRVLRDAGIAITGVSIGETADKATWTVHPPSLQAAAQSTINAFNPADPAHVTAELDAQIKADVDDARLTSAIVWAIIDTYSPPATTAKYNAARTKIIAAFKAQPWKP